MISLQTRLVLFTLFISLVPLVVISVRDILQTQQALTASAEASLRSSAEQTANSLDTFIQTTLEAIAIESKISDFTEFLMLRPEQRPVSKEIIRAQDLLKKLSTKDTENIISYALVDVHGQVILDSSDAHAAVQIEADQPYFPQVQFSDKPILTEVIYDNFGATTITFANRVLGQNGEFIGVLRIKYNSNILQSIVSESAKTTTDSLVLLLDPTYIRLADSRNPSLIQKSIAPLTLVDYLLAVENKRFLDLPLKEQTTNFLDFEDALDNADTQPFFSVDITPNIPGDDTVAVAIMETNPWIVAYSQPTSIFLAEVKKQTQTNTILVIGTTILVAIIATVVARALTNPILALTKIANSISQGDLGARAIIGYPDEIGTLATAFNSMTNQLQSTLVGLEQRINERTAELQKNKLELETIADVAREIAIIRDMDTLLAVSANLIQERLRYYHVGIFLVDERGEYAFLRAASSAAAEEMLAINYKLRVGKTGLVGNVTSTGQAYIALDVGSDAVHFENPFLPDTRSEITLPLRSRSITIGALDIQANVSNAFNQQDIQTLQILADQLAAAIENAQLVQQVEGALNELTKSNRSQTQQIWQSTVSEKNTPTYEYNGLQVNAVPQNLAPELLKKLVDGNPIVLRSEKDQTSTASKKNISTLLVPLTVLNQVIGVIGLEQEDPSHTWSDEEIAVAQAAANRAALTLENARLLEESQKRASKERTILEATARIGSAINIENILQSTAEELERVLGDSEIVLQFNTGTTLSEKDT
ncbi:MAG: GAF domain-containing protein [Anaerolineales bacterium]|nr:GAF domain-containing protein [Anaerolineales bacterium]